MAKTLVIGFGNLLKGDDGAGIHLIQKLASYQLPEQVELIDGGVNSFAALAQLQTAKQGILIDAMMGGGEPGDIYRLTVDCLDIHQSNKVISVHDFTLSDSLRQAKLIGELPPLVIYGIEPAATDLGIELSPQVNLAVNKLIARIIEELDLII